MVVQIRKARSSKAEPIERGKSTSEHSLTDFEEEPKTRERMAKIPNPAARRSVRDIDMLTMLSYQESTRI